MKDNSKAVLFYVFSETFSLAIASGLRTLTFPLYAYLLGYSPYFISTLYAIYISTHLILAYPFGLLAQKIGSAKVSLMLPFLDSISIFILTFNNPYIFILSFFLLGIASASSSQINSLIAYNLGDKLKFVYSKMIAISLAGNIIAEGLTAVLGSLNLFKIIYLSVGSFYLAFSIVSVFIMRSLKDVNSKPEKIKLIPSRKLLTFAILSLSYNFSSYIVGMFVQIWFTIQKLSVYETSLVYMGSSILGVVSSFLTDKIKENVLLRFTTLISLSAIGGILTFAIYLPPPISVISYLALGIIGPIILTASNVIGTTILKKLNEVETGFATFSTFRMIGEILGNLSEGVLFTLGAYILPFAIGSSLGFITMVIYITLYEKITKA